MSISAEKTGLFERIVMDFYRKAGREVLPWRKEGISAYEVWVSEVMLQQTQVSRVIGYYETFLKRFPTVVDLSQTSWAQFLPYYAGLGYYRRGRNMLLTAQKVASEFGGEFPKDKKLLMKLPGVGDYTASAILSFAYGENYLAWDTNLKRVIGRFFFGSKDGAGHSEQSEESRKKRGCRVKDGILRYAQDDRKKTQEDGMQVRDDTALEFQTHAKELNAALMDFGSAICLGRPKCNVCPLSQHCVYRAEEGLREKRYRHGSGNIMSKNGIPKQIQDDGVKTNWREAQVYLWLHRDHKLYYSSHPTRFEVFILPSKYNSRSGIKAYFKDRYGLDVAVRPPHKKRVIAGKPTFFTNAQILLGEPRFAVFSKDVVKAYNENSPT